MWPNADGSSAARIKTTTITQGLLHISPTLRTLFLRDTAPWLKQERRRHRSTLTLFTMTSKLHFRPNFLCYFCLSPTRLWFYHEERMVVESCHADDWLESKKNTDTLLIWLKKNHVVTDFIDKYHHMQYSMSALWFGFFLFTYFINILPHVPQIHFKDY